MAPPPQTDAGSTSPGPPAAPDPDALLSLAMGLVTRAGQLVRSRAGSVLTSQTKSTPTDLVTEVDLATEKLVVDGLRAARPDDGVLAEEGSGSDGTSGVRWVLDPIDGTVNYAYALPQYAVSLAAEVDGEVVVGVVLDVARGRLFTAVRGGGAFVDGLPLRCSAQTDLAQALLGTGFSYLSTRRSRWAQVLLPVMPQVRDIRRLGSAALDLCAVAEGRIDCYAERDLKPWDLAGGGLVAREAGVRVEGLHGRPAGEALVIAAPPALFGPLHALLAEQDADQD